MAYCISLLNKHQYDIYFKFIEFYLIPEPTVAYPLFHGNNYMILSVMGTQRFSVELIFSPLTVNGILLFNFGNQENSLVYLKLERAVLKICFNCGKQLVCSDVSNIQVLVISAYYVS
jgi:hypothetical protein